MSLLEEKTKGMYTSCIFRKFLNCNVFEKGVCVYIYIVVRQKVLSDERFGAKLSNRESMRPL